MNAEYFVTIVPQTLVDLLTTFGFEPTESMKMYLDGSHPIYTEEGCKALVSAAGEEDSSETSDT